MLKSTIAFDFRPLVRDLSKIADYTSATLYSAVSAQLFRWNDSSSRILPAACRSYRSNHDLTEHEFSLEPDLSWFDGSPVTAGQYAARIAGVINSNTPICRRFDHLTAIDAQRRKDPLGNHEEVIRIKLRSPDNQLSNKLAHPALGPMGSSEHAKVYPDAAGPFIFRDLNDEGGSLRRRFDRRTPPQALDSIAFRFVLDPEEALSLYLQGEVDSTCPVSFPLDRIAEFAGREDFLRGPVTTFFVLIPMSGRAHGGALRQVLRAALDFDALVGVRPAGLSPWRSFSPRLSRRSAEGPTNWLDRCGGDMFISDMRGENRIKLAIENFQPNRDIAAVFSAQIRGLGGQVEEIVDNFDKPSAECDFRLCVLSNSASYPADLYRRLALSPIIVNDPILRVTYASIIHQYDIAANDPERAAALEGLDEVIWRELPVIPVANLGQFCLKRDTLAGFDWGGDASWITM